MAGLIVKLLVCPAVVYLSGLIFEQVHYSYIYQPILTGIVLAVAAHLMELFILYPGALWSSAIIDFFAATAIVYFSTVLPGATITVVGAFLTAVLLTLTEIPQHVWLIKSGKAEID